MSGRRTDLLRDGRLAKWSELLEAGLQSPTDLLLGWGLGLGSNTVNTLFGYDYFEGQFISDSHFIFVLSSFGLVGLVVFVALLMLPLLRAPRRAAVVFVVYVLLVSVPFLPLELFPSNVLIMLAWGGILGVARAQSQAALKTPAPSTDPSVDNASSFPALGSPLMRSTLQLPPRATSRGRCPG